MQPVIMYNQPDTVFTQPDIMFRQLRILRVISNNKIIQLTI